mgnify:CR=1 FL=1
MLKRLLATTMASVFIINGMTITKVDAFTDKNNQVNISLPKLNPVPENMQVNEGILTITSTVNLQGQDLADEDAIRTLKEFLSQNNIVINETYDEASTTLIIGEVEDDIKEMDEAKERIGVSATESLKEEGYVLAVDSNDGNSGTILIEGKDEDGTFYGVQTLTQLISNNGSDVYSNDVIISDEPTMKTRGIVEGFYGTPWTQEERLDQLRMYGENKMNAYIYAPKSDPYHRKLWREPYPASELDRMQELIHTADENKVDFVFAISPGLDIKFEGENGENAAEAEADFQALINKAQTLYDMGVRRFAILWDDIENNEGAKQAEILNRFNEEFVKTRDGVKTLITVPKEYWASSMFEMNSTNIKQYTQDFANTLAEDIEVMWTGNDVIPPGGVSMDDANKVTDIYGKKMMLWWNYPVNDYKEDKLALGPIYDLDTNLDDEISGFIVNPMRFAEASKISTITGADYAWNTKNYDYNRSWDTALEIVGGEAKDSLKEFANHTTRLDTGRPDSPELNSLITSMWEKWNKGEDVSSELNELTSEFEKMKSTPDTLRNTLRNEKLLEQIEGHLEKFEMYANTGLMTVEMLKDIKLLKNILIF